MPSGIADRTTTMNAPKLTGQTAIGVLGEDVVGSLQHAPSMDSMSPAASTSPLIFSTTSSASQPPRRMPKERRRLDQRDGHANEERLDPAFERPFPAIPLRPPYSGSTHGQNDRVLFSCITIRYNSLYV